MSQAKNRIIAGIDPGIRTGLAIWNCDEQKLTYLRTVKIYHALRIMCDFIEWSYPSDSHYHFEIWFEDARLRTWFGNADREKLQGAGSIKRDCSIWQEFCEYYKIPFKAIKPAAGNTKWDAEYFKKITGWTGRTSQHSRDAAVLVFGVK